MVASIMCQFLQASGPKQEKDIAWAMAVLLIALAEFLHMTVYAIGRKSREGKVEQV
jgi:hypothetical protein